jgi:hypothetical protein
MRNLALPILTTLTLLAGTALADPPPPAPPPLAFTLVWHDQGEASDDPRLQGNTTRTEYVVAGNQVTRTRHYEAHGDGIVPPDETRRATLADPAAIANLVPAYKQTTTLTLPRRPAGQARGASIHVTLQFQGDAKVLSIAGETPKTPTRELAQLTTLRQALDRAFATPAAPTRGRNGKQP